jgi:hypothetical protein
MQRDPTFERYVRESLRLQKIARNLEPLATRVLGNASSKRTSGESTDQGPETPKKRIRLR